MLFWALFASGQITMRKVDGWQSLALKPTEQTMSRPRFFWTPICPTGGGDGEVQHEQNHKQ
jgi:hypothetical protein